MKILVLIDKFKGTLSSKSLGNSAKQILSKKGHDVDYFSVSDGGDGFLDSINNNYIKKYCYVHSPYGKKIKVEYLMNDEKVYIEVAKIIGVKFIDKNNNIFNASSFGVGEVIINAIKHGGKHFYIGLGGTITNDGGKGMLEALGYVFDNNGISLKKKIDYSLFKFDIVSDVKNPLLGINGATYVFSKQKCAKNEDMPPLEKRMEDFSKAIKNYVHKDFSNKIGAGAAGGLGFAFLSVLNAKYNSGIDFILKANNIKRRVKNYDLIITGEGKIDNQSLNGKVAFEILKVLNKPTIMVCGINELKETLNFNNLKGIYSIVPSIALIDESLKSPLPCFIKLINSIKL